MSRLRLEARSMYFCIKFFKYFEVQNTSSFPCENIVDTEMGQALTYRAMSPNKHHQRPSNVAARTLRATEHAPFKVLA